MPRIDDEAEIRTRRLVIIGPDGRDRVVIEAGPHHGSVLVRAVTAGTGTTGVELYAVDPIDADGPEIGLALVLDGEEVGSVRWLGTH